MPITTLDSVLTGMLPQSPFFKTTGTMEAAGVTHSTFESAGFPGPAVASVAGLAGEALTSYAGALPFPAAVGGKDIYLARIEVVQTSSAAHVVVNDRLWHNSGFVVTSTGSQTINSVTLPPRDRNEATAGDGVMFAMEAVTGDLGAGTPTLTVTYTNSAGTSGRTGTIGPISTTSRRGSFYRMSMQDGDVGVRSVQAVQSSATMTSGAVAFVLYREIVAVPTVSTYISIDRDIIALGVPKVADSAVPFITIVPNSTATTIIDGSLVWSQV
jgi:hypothetical protein